MGPWTTTFSMPQSTSNPPAPTQTYWTINSGGWAQKSGLRQALQLNLMHTQLLIFSRFFKMFYFWLCWVFIAECGLSLVAPFEVCPYEKRPWDQGQLYFREMHWVLGLPQWLKHEGLKIDGVCRVTQEEEGPVPQGGKVTSLVHRLRIFWLIMFSNMGSRVCWLQ